MSAQSLDRRLPDVVGYLKSAPALCIGILIGVIMPIVSAWVYPTYMNKMPDSFAEWTRLQELPFVLCEALVFGLALLRGMELRQFTKLLPRDCLIAAGVFLVGLWGSTLFISKVPMTSLTISLSYELHILFGFSLYHLFASPRKLLLDQLVIGLGAGLVVLSLLTAWRFLLPPPGFPVPGGPIDWTGALPGFISVRHFGSWTAAIAAIFAAIILRQRDDVTLCKQHLFFLISMAMTIWSGTRAAILAICLSCTILMLNAWRWPSLKVIGRLSILTGMAALIAYVLLPVADPNFRLFAAEDSYSNLQQIGNGRTEMWEAAFDQWLKAPWFGWGSGSTFWEVHALGWAHTQPHNFVLQFLVSWGVVGAIPACWLLGRAVIAAHRRVQKRAPESWPLLAGLYALLAMACLEGMLHYPRFIMLIMLLFAAIFRLTSKNAETA